ncbi:MAG: hypothetical protein JRI68_00930, partial [Deltaproteobacteria bacterium]|nr:hypothetical protein [Deltaproteobacteria bacterium]
EAYLDCVISKSDCDDNRLQLDSDDCDNESEDYYECVSDATDLGSSSGSSTSSSGSDYCFCTCTCESGGTFSECNGSGCCSSACESQCSADGLGASTAVEEMCGAQG